jgi:hypothetical protein
MVSSVITCALKFVHSVKSLLNEDSGFGEMPASLAISATSDSDNRFLLATLIKSLRILHVGWRGCPKVSQQCNRSPHASFLARSSLSNFARPQYKLTNASCSDNGILDLLFRVNNRVWPTNWQSVCRGCELSIKLLNLVVWPVSLLQTRLRCVQLVRLARFSNHSTVHSRSSQEE